MDLVLQIQEYILQLSQKAQKINILANEDQKNYFWKKFRKAS